MITEEESCSTVSSQLAGFRAGLCGQRWGERGAGWDPKAG